MSNLDKSKSLPISDFVFSTSFGATFSGYFLEFVSSFSD